MSLYAVETYIASALNGLSFHGAPGAVQAWVLPPPVVYPTDNPQAYVWGGAILDARATIPRTFGQRRVEHTVNVYLQSITSSDDGVSFPKFIDAVRSALLAIALPVPLLDPYDGQASVLQDLGETIRVQHPTPLPTRDQSMLQNVATVTLPVHEWLQG